jgi:hypothetical protein
VKLLLDHCTPKSLGRELRGHEVATARDEGWDKLSNGALMRAAAGKGYDAMLTVDRSLRHQQSKVDLPLAVIVLQAATNNVRSLRPLVPSLLQLLNQRLDRRLYPLGTPLQR